MAQQELHAVLVLNDPQRAYPAFQLAMGTATMRNKPHVHAATAGLNLLKKGVADRVQLPGYPPLGQALRDAIKCGADVCAYAASGEILKTRASRRRRSSRA